MLAEAPMGSSLVGELGTTITTRQFGALRDGDRCYFEKTLASQPDLLRAVQRSSLLHLIRANSGIHSISSPRLLSVTICVSVVVAAQVQRCHKRALPSSIRCVDDVFLFPSSPTLLNPLWRFRSPVLILLKVIQLLFHFDSHALLSPVSVRSQHLISHRTAITHLQ
jgi:hypothetical protein